MSKVWFASATVGDRDATLEEVKAAIMAMGLDEADVQVESDGCFLTPLSRDDQDELEMIGYLEIKEGDLLLTVEAP